MSERMTRRFSSASVRIDMRRTLHGKAILCKTKFAKIPKFAGHPERSGGGKAGAAESKDPVERSTTVRDPSAAFRPRLLSRDGTTLRMTALLSGNFFCHSC